MLNVGRTQIEVGKVESFKFNVGRTWTEEARLSLCMLNVGRAWIEVGEVEGVYVECRQNLV